MWDGWYVEANREDDCDEIVRILSCSLVSYARTVLDIATTPYWVGDNVLGAHRT